METNYSQEQEAFRVNLRRFLEDNAGCSYTRAQWQEPTGATPALWQGLVDIGVTSLLAPAAVDGFSGSMSDMGIAMEELGRAVNPAPVWASCVGGTSAAAVFGLDDLLVQLIGGSKTATLAIEEPGWDFTRWQHPQLVAQGDTLNGTKVQVPDAIGSDYLFVTTDQGVYLVNTDAQGLSLEPVEQLDGSRRFATATFSDVAGTHLGAVAQLQPVINRMLVALCADGLGAAQRAMELTVSYAGERSQFGQPIGSFQAIQHICADMLQQLELGRAGLHYALWAADEAEPDQAYRAAVMCKAYMADTLHNIGANAIQVFGGAGFTWEYDIQLFYKRLLSLQMTWGAAEVWLEELATLVID